jgi:hypothetical protein
MSESVKKILATAKVYSEYLGTKIDGGGMNCVRGKYVRNEVSIWVEFAGHCIEYQTGLSFIGGDFNCPSDYLEVYECSDGWIDAIIADEYDQEYSDPIVLDLTEDEAKELVSELRDLAIEEFERITEGYSNDPDDYYIDPHDCAYYQKESDGHYCIAQEDYANGGEWVEGTLYKVVDTRDGETEEVVAESIEDAAERAGVYIRNYHEEYIDRDYEIIEAA